MPRAVTKKRAKKRAPTNQPQTTQLGLAAALGDGSVAKPESRLLDLADLDGQIDSYDQYRFTRAEWTAFRESIRTGGLEQDIIVRPGTKPGRYRIVEGRHRTLVHKQLRLKQIAAKIRNDYTERTAALAEVRVNSLRSEPSPWDEAKAFKRANEDGANVAQIATNTGYSQSTVRERLRMAALPDELGKKIADRTMAEEAIPILHALKKEDQEAYDIACDALKKRKSQHLYLHEMLNVLDKAFDSHRDKYMVISSRSFADFELRHNPSFRKQIGQLKGIKVKQGAYRDPWELTFEPEKALDIRERAVKRLSAPRGSPPSGEKTTKVDVEGRVMNRVRKQQLELAASKIKGAVSFGDDWKIAIYKRFLMRVGMIGSRKVDRAAMAEATGIQKWEGRGEDLVQHVEKLGWDTVEGQRVLAMALHLASKDYDHMVPDTFAGLTVGVKNTALKARARAEVMAELKAKKAPSKKAVKQTSKKSVAKKSAKKKAAKKAPSKKRAAKKAVKKTAKKKRKPRVNPFTGEAADPLTCRECKRTDDEVEIWEIESLDDSLCADCHNESEEASQ